MKVIPDKLMSLCGREIPVVSVNAIPPSQRTPNDAPIVQGLTLVVCTLANGENRYFGTSKAEINSRLRMQIEVNPRDEVLAKWEEGTA